MSVGYLVGRAEHPQGAPASGSVTFTLVGPVRSEDGVVAASAVVVPLEADGRLAVELAAGVYDVSWRIDAGEISTRRVVVTGEHTVTAPLDLAQVYDVPERGVTVQTLVVPAGGRDGQLLSYRDGRLIAVDPAASTGDGAALASHVNDPTPHPAYDDLPDLAALLRLHLA